ncbi:MAG: lysophospholipid acyltransferase family protein [Candidatus Omnitrophota bacterium]
MNLPPEEFKSRLSNFSLNALKWALFHLPRWFISFILNGLFFIALIGLKKQRGICLKNLRSVYGETKSPREYKALAAACIKNIGHSMTDLLYYVERPKQLSRLVTLEHEDRLIKALAQGKGVIAVSAHLGNFPLLFVSLVQRGYKINVIIRPMRNKTFSRFMFGLCEQWKINMIQTVPPRKFFKDSLSALRRNELLFILLDEEAKEEAGVEVDFLNSRVTRAAGPLLFHARTGSPILPVFVVKEDRTFRIVIEEALNIEKALSPAENDIKNITALTRVIESYVQKYPVQWGGWLNKRWGVD